MKVLVIGVDGGTFDLIKPWIKQRKLPNFEKIIKKGVHGNLKSTIPPITSVAWPSFMTGKNPGKHGLFGFVNKKTKSGSESYKIISSKNIKSKCIWDYLDEVDKKSIVINVPVTYPPKKINGILLSGMLTPSEENYANPSNISKEIEKSIGEYSPNLDGVTLATLNQKKSWEQLMEMIDKRYAAAELLMDKYPSDFFMVEFQATDIVCHRMWHNKKKILEVYQKIDKYIGKLLEKKPNTNAIILSDHGFGSYKKYVRLNQFFEEQMLLNRIKNKGDFKKISKIKRSKNSLGKLKIETFNFLAKILLKIGITREKGYQKLSKKFISNIVKIIPSEILKILVPISDKTIDYENSKCYMQNKSPVITIKAKDKKEYQKIVQRLKKDLNDLRDPDTNQKIIKEVFSKDEIYSGEYVSNAPDIILVEHDDYLLMNEFGKDIIEKQDFPMGCHKLNGIFMGCGPDIKTGHTIKNARIIDVAPTILHMMGTKIPKDMDGIVLKDIFKKNSCFSKEEEYTEQKSSEKEKVKDNIKKFNI